MFIDGEHWVCPYCGDIGFRCTNENMLQDQILDHFSNDCDNWKAGKGEMLQPSSLKQKAEKTAIRFRLQKRPVWRIYDLDNHWYCPYCSKVTEIERPFGDKIADDMIDRVNLHLRSCTQARKTLPKEVPLETLREVVQKSNRLKGLVASIRSQFEATNELWSQCDKDGHWVCPYCVRVVEEINFMDTEVAVSIVPGHIADHLVTNCTAFKQNSNLTRDTEEFKQMVQEIREGKRARTEMEELKGRLDSANAELETAASELERAKEVQRSILPSTMPVIDGFDIACTYQPAAQLGGDFYTFIEVDEDHLGFLVADVSGHGADAALVMTMAKKAFDLRGPDNCSPRQVLGLINQDIFGDLQGKHFVTAFYGILSLKDHSVTFSRAGHNYPLVHNPTRRPSISILKSTGSALGFGPSEIFEKTIEERELPLQAGDLLLVYTDGLVESKNAANEEFELPYVCDVLKQNLKASAEEVTQAIMRAVTDFCEGRPQEDDIALMAIRYTGSK